MAWRQAEISMRPRSLCTHQITIHNCYCLLFGNIVVWEQRKNFPARASRRQTRRNPPRRGVWAERAGERRERQGTPAVRIVDLGTVRRPSVIGERRHRRKLLHIIFGMGAISPSACVSLERGGKRDSGICCMLLIRFASAPIRAASVVF